VIGNDGGGGKEKVFWSSKKISPDSDTGHRVKAPNNHTYNII